MAKTIEEIKENGSKSEKLDCMIKILVRMDQLLESTESGLR